MIVKANKAVFLDKDGTLIKNQPYNVDPSRIKLLDGVVKSLQVLQQMGFLLIVVSNQDGIARGYFTEKELMAANSQLEKILAAHGIKLQRIYCSFYYPLAIENKFRQRPDWHKPAPGMLLQAANDWILHLEESWMIGDILHDVEAGNRAGCHTILLDNGNETEWKSGPFRIADFIAANWTDISKIIQQYG